MKERAERAALSDALAMLARRDYSIARLGERLIRKGHAAESVEHALRRCAELSYLDDHAYGVTRAAGVLRRRPCGRPALLHDLRRQGVPPTITERVADEAYAERGGEAEVLAEAVRRWVECHGPPSDWPAIRRCADHLGRRGFPGTGVQAALSPWLDDLGSC